MDKIVRVPGTVLADVGIVISIEGEEWYLCTESTGNDAPQYRRTMDILE